MLWSNDFCARVQEQEKSRESMKVFFNYVKYSTVAEIGYISSRTLWIKFKFSRVKVCVVVLYHPTGGGKEE